MRRAIVKEYNSTQKKLTKLFKQKFSSSTEAELNLKLIQSPLKYHLINEIQTTENQLENQETTYQITGIIQANNDVIESYQNRAVRFIIATNRLDCQSFSPEKMLRKYKEQQQVERGFAFLKDPLFLRTRVLRSPQNREMSVADSVFLKSPRRIETMASPVKVKLIWYLLHK
ncbi:MAG: hypothetical protein QNJ53_29595 [Pleurocapsa sp. MO_192.B19]|nr:hypothetical protein [Pleurocapsa sp. MO_192.B19]